MSVSAYKYDVYISYKSEDRPWAMKLSESLRAKGLVPYLDEEGLKKGIGWERQLGEAMQQSHHLVVLWSDKADTSPWVRREIGTFEARIYGSNSDDTCMIFIVMDGDASAYNSLEKFYEIKNADAYAAGAERLDEDIWRKIINKIEESIVNEDTSRPVLLAVMAMTNERLQKIDPDSHIQGSFKSLNEFLIDSCVETIKTKEDLIQYYGDHPEDWRPFGSTNSISAIMDSLKGEINAAIGERHVRWQLIDESFWSNDFDTVRQEALKLTSGWAIVVIDPVSFYDEDIRAKIHNHLYLAFDNPKAVFIALPPFTLFPSQVNFRTIMKQVTSQIFDHFYSNKIIARGSRAYCNLNIGDGLDIRQYLMTTIGCGVLTESSETKNAVLHL
jgi:TIR domain